MSADVGRNVVFTWGGVEIDGVREKGVSRTGNAIDVTSDENDGKRALLTVSAQDEVNISLSGVVKSDQLAGDWASGNRTKPFSVTYPTGRTITGTAFLQSYNETVPYMDAITWEAELLSTGAVTETPGI